MNRPNRPTSVARLLAALLLLAPAVAGAQAEAQRVSVPFSDPGRPGKLVVELVNGSITVDGYDGAEVLFEVEAEAREAREKSTESGMRVIPNTAFGFSVEEEGNVMEVESESWNRRIELSIKVPRRTSLHLSTVNHGHLAVRGVEGELELSNTNGRITAEQVAGSVVAETVNGGITVSLTGMEPGSPMAFATLNGDVDVTFPAGLSADVVLDAGNGSIYSDFEIELAQTEPRVSKDRDGGRYRVEIEREMRGKIGSGGPEMRFETFNGSIYLRRGD